MRSILAVLTALALAGAAAAHPQHECDPEVTLETPVGTYYVDNDMCQPDCLFSIWIYQESNGEPGCNDGETVVL